MRVRECVQRERVREMCKRDRERADSKCEFVLATHSPTVRYSKSSEREREKERDRGGEREEVRGRR